MAFDSTITEIDLDQATQSVVGNLRNDGDFEPDLAIDGLTDSFLSRLLGLFGIGGKS